MDVVYLVDEGLTDCRQDIYAGESLPKPFAENQHPRQLFGLTIINTITVNVVWVVGYLFDLCVDGYMKGTCDCTCYYVSFLCDLA